MSKIKEGILSPICFLSRFYIKILPICGIIPVFSVTQVFISWDNDWDLIFVFGFVILTFNSLALVKMTQIIQNSRLNSNIVVPCFVTVIVLFILLDIHLFSLVLNSKGPIPLHFNETNSNCYVSPFCMVDVKSLFLDWPNFYIYNPISIILYNGLKISSPWFRTVMTADHITLTHLILAIIAAKLVSNDSILYRRLGVVTFELRNFFDSFDGVVARGGKLITSGKSTGIGSRGYYMDGIADLTGCLMLGYGLWMYSKAHPLRFKNPHNYYSQFFKLIKDRLTNFIIKISTRIKTRRKCRRREDEEELIQRLDYKEPKNGNVTHGGQLIFWFGTQGVVNSFAWNRYIATFTRLLQNFEISSVESTETTIQRQLMEGIFLREFMTMFIIFIWRVINIHAFIELLIIFIFLDKLPQLLIFIFYYGWFHLLIAIGLSEIVLGHGRFLFSNVG